MQWGRGPNPSSRAALVPEGIAVLVKTGGFATNTVQNDDMTGVSNSSLGFAILHQGLQSLSALRCAAPWPPNPSCPFPKVFTTKPWLLSSCLRGPVRWRARRLQLPCGCMRQSTRLCPFLPLPNQFSGEPCDEVCF